MLVSLKQFGSDACVNPKYVTAIEPTTFKSYSPHEPPSTPGVEVWVVGHAGYGTFSISLKGASADDVRAYLNREDKKS